PASAPRGYRERDRGHEQNRERDDDHHQRRGHLPEPDRRRRDRAREIERQPALAEIAADDGCAEDYGESPRESDGEKRGGRDDHLMRIELPHARNQRREKRHEREHARGDQHECFLADLAPRDGEGRVQTTPPSASTAMKISSSDIAPTSAAPK